jgi:hypothetical protein
VASRDEGDLAVQVGGVEVDAGDDTGAGGVLAQHDRGAFVVLGPGLAGQRLHLRRAAFGEAVAGRDHDDHFVGAEELVRKARVAGQARRRVGDDRDVELAVDRALVQLAGQPGQQLPRERPGRVDQAAHGGGHHAGRQRRRRADPERADGRPVAGFPGGANAALCLVDRGLGVATERFTGGGGPDAPRVPFDKRRADLALKPGDLP